MDRFPMLVKAGLVAFVTQAAPVRLKFWGKQPKLWTMLPSPRLMAPAATLFMRAPQHCSSKSPAWSR